nr:hypothetical protein KPHV_00820 [Kitasatospora purpeofusca]
MRTGRPARAVARADHGGQAVFFCRVGELVALAEVVRAGGGGVGLEPLDRLHVDPFPGHYYLSPESGSVVVHVST